MLTLLVHKLSPVPSYSIHIATMSKPSTAIIRITTTAVALAIAYFAFNSPPTPAPPSHYYSEAKRVPKPGCEQRRRVHEHNQRKRRKNVE